MRYALCAMRYAPCAMRHAPPPLAAGGKNNHISKRLSTSFRASNRI